MDTAEILFIASDPLEFSGALRFWKNVQPVNLPVHWARSALRKNRPVLAVANGAGWDRARLASEAAPHNQLCNIGFCGALSPALQIADIFVSSGHLPVRTGKPFHSGRLYSSRSVVGTAQEKAALHAQGFAAVDMESAGLAAQPFFCIKAVSDLARESFDNNFNTALQPDGRISKPRIVLNALRSPFRRFPELVRFARNSAAASRSLGEFLDSCDF